MTRSASQLGVYETYEEFHGRKSTMDELIADVAQFSQQSMLWVCAVIITGMQLWDRIDNQPAGVFDTLIKLYFDRPFHARLLAGFWGANPRKVLFHRRQILLIAKLSIKHGAKGSLDARVNAQLIGQTLLKANDQLSHGLLDERSLPKEGGFPTTREDLSKLVVEMLATGEDGSIHIPQMMTRSHLMLTRFVEELRGHSDWIDLAGEYETTTGLSLEEREAMIMAVHSRYGAQLSKDLYRDPGVLPLKEGNFGTTAVSRTKASAFLSAVSGTVPAMAKELNVKDDGANDTTVFRKYPLIGPFYNGHLKNAWLGYLMMDNGFLLEKVLSGPYWHAVSKYGQRLHRFWGAVFERYVHELMMAATTGTSSTYLPDPRSAVDPSVQLCDGVLRWDDCLVLMEYKGAIFRADAKYSGNPTMLAAEIEKKLVHDHQSGKKKGVEQLAEAVKIVFGPGGETTFPQISLKGIKRVYLYIITLDSIGGTIGMSTLLNTFLDPILDRTAYPGLEIRPLFCSEVEALEAITMLFGSISLPQMLENWYQDNTALALPLQSVDFGNVRWEDNKWLQAEWVERFKSTARILFPNETPDEAFSKGMRL